MALLAHQMVTGKARLSYIHVLQPYARSEADTAKYSVTILIPKSDTATKARIDAAIKAALQNGRNSGKFDASIPLDRLPTPIHDGDGVRADGYTEYGSECKGHWVFTASCNADRPPRVIDAGTNPIIDPAEMYSGIYGRCIVSFFPYISTGKKGIGCGLEGVQKLCDGEPLGGGMDVVDVFASTAIDPFS